MDWLDALFYCVTDRIVGIFLSSPRCIFNELRPQKPSHKYAPLLDNMKALTQFQMTKGEF